MSAQPAPTEVRVEVPEDVLLIIFETLIQDLDPEDVCKHVERWLLGCGAGSAWCRPRGVGSEIQWERIAKPLMYLVPSTLAAVDGWEQKTWREAFIDVSTTLFHWRDNLCHHHLLWYKRTLEIQNAFAGEERLRYEPWLKRCVFEWRERFMAPYAQPISTFSVHKMPTFQLATPKLLYAREHSKAEHKKWIDHFHAEESARKAAMYYKKQDKLLAEGIKTSVNSDVERALQRGANPNQTPCALELVIHNGLICGEQATRVLDTLLAWPGTDVNMRGSRTTALHAAVAMDQKISANTSLLKKLLDAGGDVHQRDHLRHTPLLHLASENCPWSECVECLVARGADVNARDSSSNTPLLLALNRRNLRVADALLDLGADVRVYNRYQETPHDLANKCLRTNPKDKRWMELVGRLDALYAAQNA